MNRTKNDLKSGSSETQSDEFLDIPAPAWLPVDDGLTTAMQGLVNIHIGRAGLLRRIGHDLWLTARVSNGHLRVLDSPGVEFSIEAEKISLVPDKGFAPTERAVVEQVMRQRVLKSAEHPEIRFSSTEVVVTGARTWRVTGNLTLRSVVKPLTFEVVQNGDSYAGITRIKLSDFKIDLRKRAFGLARLKDEADITFEVWPADC